MDIVFYDKQQSGGKLVFSREKLLSLRTMGQASIVHPIPEELRRAYRGCRAGAKVKAKLAAKRWKYKPSVPSIVMGNVNCLTNKTDALAALVRNGRTYRESSLLCLSETWLTANGPDANVDLPGFTTVRADRDAKCSVVSCSDPGKVEHSRRVLSGPHFTVASTIQYICNKGFSLSGNSLLTCFNRGSSGPKWNQKLPRCLPEIFEPCGHPGTPTYGIPSSNKLHFQAGETLHYSCLTAHQLLGEPVLHCVPGHPSQWSGLPPVCKAHPAEHDEHRLDVSTADLRMEGAQVAFAVFIPIILLLIFVIGIYLYYSKLQRKPLQLSLTSNLPYEIIPGEPTFDNSVYETTETREYEVSI